MSPNKVPMCLLLSRWPAALLLSGVLLCTGISSGFAQVYVHVPVQTENDGSPFGSLDGSRFRDGRDRGFTESVRRFGRQHQNARILGVEPILIEGRSLNRIKSLDEHGRILIWIDDPQAPHNTVRGVGTAADDDGW